MSGWSMTPIAGMKNVAGTWCRSRRSRIRGTDVVAPYSPTDKGTGRGFARCSNSLSTSNVRQTATRAPLGQVLGVSFLPTLAVATACRICSSLESSVIGLTAAAACWLDGGADWARGELQPGSNPMRTSGTTHVCRLHEQSMMASRRELSSMAGRITFSRRDSGRDMMTTITRAAIAFGALVAVSGLPTLVAQNAQPAGGGGAEMWWVNKTKGGVYNPPMRPLWKLSDLKRMHAGQNNWQEQVIRDPEQDATYNSAAPGRTFGLRLHPDTPTVFVVIAGDVRFSLEAQQPVTATRGSIVNIMKTTLFSYEIVGGQNAVWVEV